MLRREWLLLLLVLLAVALFVAAVIVVCQVVAHRIVGWFPVRSHHNITSPYFCSFYTKSQLPID
jgi:hypothetical protein